MRSIKTFACAVLGVALICGCESRKDETAAPATPAAPAANANGSATTQPTADATAAAQKLLDETTQYIKDNKLDLADKSLSQVEKMRPQLPASYGPKIDDARKALNAAKTASGGLKALGGGSQ